MIGPALKAVEEYKASLMKSPNPPAANMTILTDDAFNVRFGSILLQKAVERGREA
ncbi:hypothetical protein [Bradyrhizobium sp. AUGA SZCCT0431]|uniref:hypothetical protein n=1 Tax=Bradyrhizobium sp. AUGA SZCCT0431 TaxID=2807674 RepID=UPI001BA81322|nr:hypothetical protein [Bradyrhizobium sp. AUGA SZCCT0431]MBR1148992.1 hypothetical protein [Bradyrhizobium sp. AUGA SZCCT0431]